MYHKISILGNLGNDPELSYFASGKAVVNMSIATNRAYTAKDGQRVKKTTWFRVSAFGTMAENCEKYLSKGALVYVEGRLRADDYGNPRIWERNDGSTAASFEVDAIDIRFLSSNRNNRSQRPEPEDNLDAWESLSNTNIADEEEEDYPF